MERLIDTLKKDFKSFRLSEKELYTIMVYGKVNAVEVDHKNGKVSKMILELSNP